MKKIFYLLVLSLSMSCSKAQTPNYITRVVKDNLFIPWEIIYGVDDHIWFTQKNGYICRMDPATGQTDTIYHETNTVIQNEGGMLGMAMHPDFTNNPYVYVAYEYTQSSNYKERIVRYTYSGNTLQSPQILLDNITGANIHNGCRLLIVDDKLFITVGDAATSSNAQNVNSLNGKILRINLDGSIPADNPLPNNPVWSWGHRNAQGLVYQNNMLYSSEHGNTTDDEINIIYKGRNHGWPNVEGYCNTSGEMTFCNDSNVVEPLQIWTPTIAPSGIDYYNHPMYPTLQHSLILATLKDQHLYQLKLNGTHDSIISATVMNIGSFGRLRDVCISPQGKIYVSTSNSTASGNGSKVDKIIEISNPNYTSVSSVINNSMELALYPNPVTDQLFLNAANYPIHYVIYNLLGQTVAEGTLQQKGVPIALKVLAAGIYPVHATDNTGNISIGKIYKQ